jgi:DNA mismatch endonuclease, patch repair protein
MADTVPPHVRSRIMSAIRGKDTKPEMIVRRLVWAMGYRYRLHVKHLPGSPDLVLHGTKKIIFVHGCFWHVHTCTRGKSTPTTQAEFWRSKRENNQARDYKVLDALKKAGWKVLVVWECETKDTQHLATVIKRFLGTKPVHRAGGSCEQ